MSKPDWAERLQRTFNRKYEEGVAEGILIGYQKAQQHRQNWLNRIQTWYPEKHRAFIEGYELGLLDREQEIIEALEKADSACSGWAVAIVKETHENPDRLG